MWKILFPWEKKKWWFLKMPILLQNEKFYQKWRKNPLVGWKFWVNVLLFYVCWKKILKTFFFSILNYIIYNLNFNTFWFVIFINFRFWKKNVLKQVFFLYFVTFSQSRDFQQIAWLVTWFGISITRDRSRDYLRYS